MNCFLMRDLPMPLILRLWDTYMAEGTDGFSVFHIYLCAAFLVHWSARIRALVMPEILLFLQHHNDTAAQPEQLRATAKSLLFTCFLMANSTRSGLPPESVVFSDKQGILIRKNQKHYSLRPETIESLFYLKETEHDPIAQEWGWILYQAIERNCRVEGGYAMFSDVEGDGKPEDSVESFFPGETLKYLYLLFKAESIVDLQKVVLTTEAHIIPVQQSLVCFTITFPFLLINAIRVAK